MDSEAFSLAWRRSCERRARSGGRLPPGSAYEPWADSEESTAALPEGVRESLAVRLSIRLLQFVCIVYGAALVFWIWLSKDISAGMLLKDPIFNGYSVLVSVYVISRFCLAPFYRPAPDTGLRPSVSIVIPAFNEQEAIGPTIDACYGADYPGEKLQVVVVDDGSSDATWKGILAARKRHPTLLCVRFERNCGKRAAMAEGIRRATGDVCIFIDSDSVIEAAGIRHLVADFRDPRVGAVVGSADVLNKVDSILTKMQQVRYYVAFRVIKGSESLFGAVTCASGCFSGYRREALLEILDRWENQTFLGARATFGDDRALTNYVLRDWRVTYQSLARSHTLVPTKLRIFLRQQLRWKKSWLRESLHVGRFIWRKHPAASVATYFSILFPWVAPLVVIHAVVWRTVSFGDPWMYLVGVYVMALLYSLYYAVSRKSPLWFHGMTFVLIYMTMLVWLTYYAVLTIRDTRWGTRSSAHGTDTGEITEIAARPLADPVGLA